MFWIGTNSNCSRAPWAHFFRAVLNIYVFNSSCLHLLSSSCGIGMHSQCNWLKSSLPLSGYPLAWPARKLGTGKKPHFCQKAWQNWDIIYHMQRHFRATMGPSYNILGRCCGGILSRHPLRSPVECRIRLKCVVKSKQIRTAGHSLSEVPCGVFENIVIFFAMTHPPQS